MTQPIQCIATQSLLYEFPCNSPPPHACACVAFTWNKDEMAGQSKERFKRSLALRLRREGGLGWHRTGLDGEAAVRLG